MSRTYASAQAIGASSLATEGPLQPYALFHHASSKQVPVANENTYDPNGLNNMAFQYAQDHVQADAGAPMGGNAQILHNLRDDESGNPAKNKAVLQKNQAYLQNLTKTQLTSSGGSKRRGG